MNIPKHRICDICDKEVGYNKRYFIVKSKNFICCSAGSVNLHGSWDICEDCMYEFQKYLHYKLREKGGENNEKDSNTL